jgi:DNA-binding transcriptional ArsR family regulator
MTGPKNKKTDEHKAGGVFGVPHPQGRRSVAGSDSSAHPSEAGRFAYEGIERVLHEKARLSIMTSLVTHPAGLVFNDLKDLCSLTDGNLSRHLQVLQEARLVEVWKGVQGNRPQTLCRLSDDGRKRFLEYIAVLENVVADALGATRNAAPARNKLMEGWSPA